jgi:cytochrome c oxidase subunit IV
MTDNHSQHPASGAAAAHGHGGHGDGHGHTAPMSLLIGVLLALIVLTVLTVGVTAVDLGSQGNLIVAMIVATVKAILVMGFFMHLFWDSKFNVIAFSSSFLFVILFLAMAVLDRSEYRSNVQNFENDAAQAAKK